MTRAAAGQGTPEVRTARAQTVMFDHRNDRRTFFSGPSSATAAIASLDAAISTVTISRANLGAIQNRLENTISRLGMTAENLQAAESRIRDADMASEMITFTKNQILQQSGMAMLAQANQAPQSVLSLLR